MGLEWIGGVVRKLSMVLSLLLYYAFELPIPHLLQEKPEIPNSMSETHGGNVFMLF